MKVILPALVIATTLTVPLSAQSTSDFSGTWTLDPARSESAVQDKHSVPVTVVIHQTPVELRIETQREGTSETITYRLDGSEVGNAADSRSRSSWEGATLITDVKRPVNGKTVSIKEARSLDPTGREMTIVSMLEVEHGYERATAPNAVGESDKNYVTFKNVFVKAR